MPAKILHPKGLQLKSSIQRGYGWSNAILRRVAGESFTPIAPRNTDWVCVVPLS